MVIRHSLELLEQLSELERQLVEWEKLMAHHGVEIEGELLLRLVYQRHLSLTGKREVS